MNLVSYVWSFGAFFPGPKQSDTLEDSASDR